RRSTSARASTAKSSSRAAAKSWRPWPRSGTGWRATASTRSITDYEPFRRDRRDRSAERSLRSWRNRGGGFMPQDALPLRRIDHVRLFVGNARQSAYFYRNAFGFDVVAYAGLETRVKHEAGYVLKQGQITFVLVSPLSDQHPDSQRLVRHG